MNKVIHLLLIAILALSSTCCTDKDEGRAKRRLEDVKFKYITEIMQKNGRDEFISLLSIKYELNAELTRKIIDGFIGEGSSQDLISLLDAKTVEEFTVVKAKLDRPSVEERIRKISAEDNIEKSKIASLLIDYEIWRNSKRN